MKRVLAASICLGMLTVSSATKLSDVRPEIWAQPMVLAGVSNLHKVNDRLYRSAQPTEKGMKNLEKIGIKTIVNLRAFHSDIDRIKDTNLGYEHINMKTWHPEREDAVEFLKIATNPIKTPVLVHCQHGADRTGVMIAIYRVAVQGWTKQEAALEMTQGGYRFHKVWRNIPSWFQKLDIESIKEEAGID